MISGGVACALVDVRARRVLAEWSRPAPPRPAPLRALVPQLDRFLKAALPEPGAPDSPTFRLVTDGQAVLRQYLHPLAVTQQFALPVYYARFHDLRKEYVHAYTLRAVAPTPRRGPPPPPPPDHPSALSDMLDYLKISPYVGQNTNMAKVKDMTSVIMKMLSDGFQLTLPETVDLVLEFGLWSENDEIDGNCIVRVCGLLYPISEQDVANLFRGLNIAKGGVVLSRSPQGVEAFVRFVSQEHRDMALRRLPPEPAAGRAPARRASAAQLQAAAARSRRTQFAVRMRGVSRDVTPQQVIEFFITSEDPVNVLDGVNGVIFMSDEVFVFFGNDEDTIRALGRHHTLMGSSCVELSECTPGEILQLLNCSPDTIQSHSCLTLSGSRTTDDGLLDPLEITSGTSKNCVRLRGLPYEAREEHVVTFLAEFAHSIVPQGLHMIYNCEGHSSGDAFIRMDSEASAFECAKQKHRADMILGKKLRCIQVVQCSGADMGAMLAGGGGAATYWYPETAPPRA